MSANPRQARSAVPLLGTLVLLFAESSGVQYVALGGSNTCGHFIKRSSIYCASHCKCFGVNCTFVGMLGDFMKKRGLAERTKNNCVPAMGPEIVATCLDANVSSDAGYATVEYLPNMNMGNQQEAYSREAYNALLAGLYARRVRTVVGGLSRLGAQWGA